jgi:transcriptional regulator with XRE-family HTH domain
MTPRDFLASEIRRGREAKGMSTTDLANTVFVSEPLVRAWEKGRRLPQPDHLEKLENLFGTRGLLGRMRKDLVSAAVPVEWFGRWPEIEDNATSLWTFQPLVVPGLLQTEAYARAILRAANHIADLDEMVAARMERQYVLNKEDPPAYIALIAEGVLQHQIGSAKTMTEQMVYLKELAERDDVIIQVIPHTSRACAGFLSGFVIADIATLKGGGDIAYVDSQLTGQVVEATEDVARLRRFFDIFRADACSRQESIDMIRKVADQ